MTENNPVNSGIRQHAAAVSSTACPEASLLQGALVALANEALLTVRNLASKRSRSKSEYTRHLTIAAFALEHVKGLAHLPGVSEDLRTLLVSGAGLQAWAASLDGGVGLVSANALRLSPTFAQVRSEGDALAYLADCTLATVEELALRASAPVRELVRHCAIADAAVAACQACGRAEGSRVAEVLKSGRNVKAWATGLREHVSA